MTTISNFIPPIMVARVAFWLMVLFTLAGAVIAVGLKKIVHNIFGLALSMLGITGLYLFLGSQFVAMMQLLIYVGAICITYIFAIMLSPPLELEIPKKNKLKVISALVVGIVTFVVIVQMIRSFHWTPLLNVSRDWSIHTLGRHLLTQYFLVFELISLLLAVAIIGAIMIASYGQKRD
jgi:NADH-quinone oxidoreductase subunit J